MTYQSGDIIRCKNASEAIDRAADVASKGFNYSILEEDNTDTFIISVQEDADAFRIK